MFGNSSFGNTSFGNTTFGSAFGATPSLGAFGSNNQQTTLNTAPIGTTIRFVPMSGTDTLVKSAANPGGPSQITTRHQNISAMKEYETKSNDELRLEDYAANRKVGQSNLFNTGTQNTSTPFGAFGATSTPAAGSTSLFGSTPQSNMSLFGGNTSTSLATSQPNSSPFGLFGNASKPTTSTATASSFQLGGGFGSTSQPATASTSLFGSAPQSNMSLFGSNNNSSIATSQPSSNPFGLFGGGTKPTTSTAQTNVSLFGSTTNTSLNTNQPNSNPFGLFGGPSKPSTSTTTPSFQLGGGFGNTSAPAAGGTSLFGAPPQTNTSLFGANITQQSNPIFGQNKTGFEAPSLDAQKLGGAFGSTSQPATANTSMFGTTSQTNMSLFGSNNNSTIATSQANSNPFGLFVGAAKPITSTAQSNVSLFGSNINTSLNTSQQNSNPFGLFGAATKPASNTTAPSFQLGGGFGTTGAPTIGGTSIFGAQPQANTSLFGANITQQSSPIFGQNKTGFEAPALDTQNLLINRLKTLPYGETSILSGSTFTTDPKRINQYKMDAKTNVKLKKADRPERVRTHSVLFDGLEDGPNDDLRCAIDVFVPKKEIKKLDIKPDRDHADGDNTDLSNSGIFPGDRTNASVSFAPNLSTIAPNESDRSSFNNTTGGRSNASAQTNSSGRASASCQSSGISRVNASCQSNTSGRSNVSGHSNLSSMGSNFKSKVISNRPDYILKPSLDEIERRYNQENDTCVVNSLLIERPNYGSVLFESPLDVKGLNIDEIVHIRRKEVIIYPDDENKPPVGQGLNRPAIITLHQVWPVDKTNNEPIKDIDRLNAMRYPKKIESATLEKGARFIEYRPETGSWVFAVSHFSKYAITEDDEEQPPEPLKQLEQKQLVLSKSSSPSSGPPFKRLAFQTSEAPITVGAIVPKQYILREIKPKPDLTAANKKYVHDIMSVCISGAPKVRFFNGSRNFAYINKDSVIISELKLIPSLPSERFEDFLENNSIVSSTPMGPYIETYDYIKDASSHDLLHALYGNLTSKKLYAKQDERLVRVVRWLSIVNQKIPPPTNLYQLILYHMSCDRYDLASNLALESNHPRLALLISTLNIRKDIMFEQLTSWRLSTADQYIDTELLKIYIILSGLTEWKLSNETTVFCLKGLKWTQQLCLLTLYVTSYITEPDKHGFSMLPLYMKRLETDTNDVEYHILARHNPADVLSAATTILEEWFLLESLKSFHIINSESDSANYDVIHSNLASQLASIDLRWACFVALHITNNEVRDHVLISCLERNYAQLKNEVNVPGKPELLITVESWLIDKLKVPPEYIESSRSLASR